MSYYLRWWIHWIIVHASNSETYYQRWHDLLSTLVGWRSNELLSTLLYSETYCLRCMTYCLRWWNWPPCLFEYLLFDHSAVRVVDYLVNNWISNAEQSGIVNEPLPTFESAISKYLSELLSTHPNYRQRWLNYWPLDVQGKLLSCTQHTSYLSMHWECFSFIFSLLTVNLLLVYERLFVYAATNLSSPMSK